MKIKVQQKNAYIAASLIIFLVISSFYINFSAGDHSLGFLADDAIYLLMADIYSPWINLNPELQSFLLRESHFPPLYSIVLGLFGAHTGNPALAQTITTVMLLSLLVVYFLWLLNQTGKYSVSLVLTILFGFLPVTLILSQELWSEFLFMLFVMSVFLLLDKRSDDKKWLYAAVLITFSILTRSAGIALLPVFYFLLYRARPRFRYWAIFLSIFPIIVWMYYKNSISSDGGYTRILLRRIAGMDFDGFIELMSLQFIYMWQALLWSIGAWVNNLLPLSIIKPILSLFILLAGMGLVLHIRKLRPDTIFVVLYLIIILLWPFEGPYYMSRFIYVLWPFLLYYAYCAITLMRTNYPGNFLKFFMPVITIITIAPASATLIGRGFDTANAGIEPYTHNRKWLSMESRENALSYAGFERNLEKSLKIVSKYVDTSECVFSVHPQIVMLHTKRVSYLLPDINMGKAEFDNAIKQCRYILAMRVDSIKYPALYPLDRISAGNNYNYISMNAGSLSGKPLVVLAIRRTITKKHSF